MPAPGICCAAPCCGDGGGMAGGTAAENSAAQYYDKATHQSVTEYYDSQHTRQSPNDQHLKHADGQLQSALVLINRGSLQEANDATVANNSLSTHAVHRSRRPTVVPRCPQLRVLLRHPAATSFWAAFCRNGLRGEQPPFGPLQGRTTRSSARITAPATSPSSPSAPTTSPPPTPCCSPGPRTESSTRPRTRAGRSTTLETNHNESD